MECAHLRATAHNYLHGALAPCGRRLALPSSPAGAVAIVGSPTAGAAWAHERGVLEHCVSRDGAPPLRSSTDGAPAHRSSTAAPTASSTPASAAASAAASTPASAAASAAASAPFSAPPTRTVSALAWCPHSPYLAVAACGRLSIWPVGAARDSERPLLEAYVQEGEKKVYRQVPRAETTKEDWG